MYIGVSEHRGTLLWGSYNKDPTIQGTILRSPIFGKLGSCQNYGPFLSTLNIKCRTILGTQKGIIILTTIHVYNSIYLDLKSTFLGTPLRPKYVLYGHHVFSIYLDLKSTFLGTPLRLI